MNQTETTNKVFGILEDLCASEVQDETQQLILDLQMDSLKMVMLLVMIEESFEIELEESDMNPFSLITVKDVITLISKYQKEEF